MMMEHRESDTDGLVGGIKYPVKDREFGGMRETSSLRDASKGRWNRMLSRMAQKEMVEV